MGREGAVVKELRAAVIGVGRMGTNHARIYDALEGVRLVAVVDHDIALARRHANRYGSFAYPELRHLLAGADVDLASVVTPTTEHYCQAMELLRAGVSVLIEKPISNALGNAARLVAYASRSDRVVAVGHIERCNPAVSTVKRLIDEGRIGDVYRISTHRVGPSPKRIRDVGVTLDLATHDLDVMRYLAGAEAAQCKALAQHRNHDALEDGINALIQFEGGIVGVLECDWLAPIKHRSLTVVGSKGAILADYIRQTVHVEEPGRVQIHSPREEPLLVELRAFVEAVRGTGKPKADAKDGYMAVKMAQDLLADTGGN